MTYIYIAIHVSYASFVFTWIAWAYTEKETRIRTKYRKKQGMDGEWNFVHSYIYITRMVVFIMHYHVD
ncbi:hypothetical protein ABB10_24810 [Bacillus thuringiensis]|nr:hypothetical protein [Bacillus thuringiensis]MBG9669405.1 hypothetical protein [Bacillus thuringiensis]MBH0355306.1 hypothetical protein [Bacillus thuringiensis]